MAKEPDPISGRDLFDERGLMSYCRGRLTVKVVPSNSADATSIVPP